MSNAIGILEEMDERRIFLSTMLSKITKHLHNGDTSYISTMLKDWIKDPVGKEMLILMIAELYASELYASEKEVTIESLLTHDSIIARELGLLAQRVAKG